MLKFFVSLKHTWQSIVAWARNSRAVRVENLSIIYGHYIIILCEGDSQIQLYKDLLTWAVFSYNLVHLIIINDGKIGQTM